VAYAEAVFASGGEFGYCTDEEEGAAFWSKLVGEVWRPPSRNLMLSKYVNIVFHKVDASMRVVLASLVVGCYQCDGWTGPNGEKFSVFSSVIHSLSTCRRFGLRGAESRRTR